MSANPATCTGCANAQPRFRMSKPALHCLRYHTPAMARCLDYRTQRTAIAAALDYLKRTSLK